LQTLFQVQLSMAEFFRGNLASALSHAKAACPSHTGESIQGFGIGTLFRHMAYAGDRDGTLTILDEERALVPRSGQPNSTGSWFMLALLIEGLFILGEHSRARELYPLARELLDTGAVVLWPIFRFTHTVAGMAATAARHWDAAEDHFGIAMKQAESFPNQLEQTEIRRFHAMMLLDRAGRGDREAARSLLSEARESYARISMPRHMELTQALIGKTAIKR
jgi:hypothetical protein